jgi:hypothetical protein
LASGTGFAIANARDAAGSADQRDVALFCRAELGGALAIVGYLANSAQGRRHCYQLLSDYLTARQRRNIEAACVDMWEPFRLSIEQWAPNCRIVYDKFHIMQHANEAIDEVRRAEFLRKGGRMRGLVKGKRWLLLSRWVNLTAGKRQELNQLFALNLKVFKAYLLKESGPAVDLPLRRCDAELPRTLDCSAPLAAPRSLSEAGSDAAGSP